MPCSTYPLNIAVSLHCQFPLIYLLLPNAASVDAKLQKWARLKNKSQLTY